MIRHLDDSAQVRGYRDQGALVLRGPGRLSGRDPWRVAVDGTELTADHAVVATGSEPVRPPIEGLEELDASVVWTNREAATLTDIPGRALVVADNILGRGRSADYTAVPRVVFSHPEIAGAGITADQARERGIDTATAEVDLPESLAHPWTYDTDPRGTLGLVADRGHGVLVGAWAFAPMASERIHTAALAIRTGPPVAALIDTIPQFPTFNEAYLTALEELDL